MEEKKVVLDILAIANLISGIGKKLLMKTLEENHLSYSDYFLLNHLYNCPGSTQYSILKYTVMSKARINQVVTKLEKVGYLEKKEERKGKLIKKPIYLTEVGEKIMKDGEEQVYIQTLKTLKEIDLESISKYKNYKNQMKEILKNMEFTTGLETPKYLK